ncbi:helix-turn-helix domain-containing protein [Rhizobium laguerreae]|uniref:helix-turn-helix domain-containing protein n=1 Tax=Rhizobium laguerreae TaxID=1076926 RepID=UPI001C92B9F6|nr:helix-turn-helix transcriptional regulator [Rhizobium laguerreae]MBY3211505.1 helix-turn-helix transcriptional regulator [Rhizobium laguerreae]
MTSYRNPHAALQVGQMIQTHLTKSQLSHRELAMRLGVSDTKIVSFVTGRHYFPIEFANPTAEALGIDHGELVYFSLQQYFPRATVDYVWEAIVTHVFAQQEPSEEELGDKRRDKQKKKKKKAR